MNSLFDIINTYSHHYEVLVASPSAIVYWSFTLVLNRPSIYDGSLSSILHFLFSHIRVSYFNSNSLALELVPIMLFCLNFFHCNIMVPLKLLIFWDKRFIEDFIYVINFFEVLNALRIWVCNLTFYLFLIYKSLIYVRFDHSQVLILQFFILFNEFYFYCF